MYNYKKTTLANGLRVANIEVPAAHAVCMALYVKCGSRYEDEESNGLSHFLEHMFLRGTSRLPSTIKLHEAIESCAGTLYPATYRDYTYFYQYVHPSMLEEALSLLGEIIITPCFESIDIERKIILEEFLEDYDGDGHDNNIDDLSRNLIWPDHPLGLKVIGTRDNILRFNGTHLREFLAKHYVGRNSVLSLSGAVNNDEALILADKAFKDMPAGEELMAQPPKDEQDQSRCRLLWSEGSQVELQLSFRAISELHPDYRTFLLLHRILDDGASSRLHRRISEELGLVYTLSASVDAYMDTGAFDIYLTVAPSKVEEVLCEIFEILRRIRTEPVPEDELLRFKRRSVWELEFMADSAAELSGWYGATELFYPPLIPSRVQEDINNIDAPGIRRVARTIFTPERLNLVALGPFRRGLRARLRHLVERAPEWLS